MTGLVNQFGLGILLEAQGNLSKETLAAARNLGLLEQAGNRAGNVINRQTRSMSGAIGTLREGLGSLPALIASVTGSFSAWKMANITIDFEHAMTDIRTQIRATTTDAEVATGRIDKLQQQIQKVARSTGRKPSEVAAGAYGLLRLGYEGAKQAMPVYSNLIAAGATPEAAAQALPALMTTFKASAAEIGGLIAKASVMTNTTVPEMMDLLSQNAAWFEANNWSTETVLELMQAATRMNLMGRDLHQFIRQTQEEIRTYGDQQRGQATKVADNLTEALIIRRSHGFAVVDEAGRVLPWPEIVKNASSFIGYKSGQGDLTANQRAMLADEGLGQNFLMRLQQDLSKMGEPVEDVHTTLEQLAAFKLDDTRTKFEQLTASVESLFQKMDVLTPLIGTAADYLRGIVDGVNNRFEQHPEEASGWGWVTAHAAGLLSLAGLKWLRDLGGRVVSRAPSAVATIEAAGAKAAPLLVDKFGLPLSSAAGGTATNAVAGTGLSAFAGGMSILGWPSVISEVGALGLTSWLSPERAKFLSDDYLMQQRWHPSPVLPAWSPPMMDSAGAQLPEDTIGNSADGASEKGAVVYDFRKFSIQFTPLPGESIRNQAVRLLQEIRKVDELKPGARN